MPRRPGPSAGETESVGICWLPEWQHTQSQSMWIHTRQHEHRNKQRGGSIRDLKWTLAQNTLKLPSPRVWAFFTQHSLSTMWRLKNRWKGLTFKGSGLSSRCNVPISILKYFVRDFFEIMWICVHAGGILNVSASRDQKRMLDTWIGSYSQLCAPPVVTGTGMQIWVLCKSRLLLASHLSKPCSALISCLIGGCSL